MMTEAKKPTVMLADDELQIRLLMKSILMSLSCDVIGEAKNGFEAVEMFARLQPDFLLLDILMPLKSGEDALAEIISCFPEAKVIMLTGISDRVIVTKCVKLGAKGFIRKDNPIPELRQRLAETIRGLMPKKEEPEA